MKLICVHPCILKGCEHWWRRLELNCFNLLFEGDQGHRRRLQAAAAHGLSRGAAPAHARLLAEGAGRPAQVRTDRQHAGQVDPQPQHAEEDRGGGRRQVRGDGRKSASEGLKKPLQGTEPGLIKVQSDARNTSPFMVLSSLTSANFLHGLQFRVNIPNTWRLQVSPIGDFLKTVLISFEDDASQTEMSMGRISAPERDNQESLLLVFHIRGRSCALAASLQGPKLCLNPPKLH